MTPVPTFRVSAPQRARLIASPQTASHRQYPSAPPGGSDRRARGQSLVELAIILPVLLLLIAGAIDLGRAYFTSISLENAVKEGAMYGARDPECATDSGTGCADPNNVQARFENELHDLTASLFQARCFAPGTTDFSGAGKALADCEDGDLYHVRGQVLFTLVTPIVSALLHSPITLGSEATAVVLTSFQPIGGTVTFPSATPGPTPSPGLCTVPDLTLGPTKLNQAQSVWANQGGFVASNLTPVGPGGQNVSWQSLPAGMVAPCDTQTMIASNAPQGTATPSPSPTPTATPTTNPSPTATPSATPTPSGNCTVPDLEDMKVTVAQAAWSQAGFMPANFVAARPPGNDYKVGGQSLAAGLQAPCLTATITVSK